MNAYNASRKVLTVLEQVREKLLQGNASERAVEAIERNIERIAEAREALKQLMARLAAKKMAREDKRGVSIDNKRERR